VLSSKEWTNDTKLSGRYVHVVGASGKPFMEKFTVPLPVQDGEKQLKHSFILSSQCPINLMGRDLSLTIASDASPTVQAYSGAIRAPEYVYTWDLLTEKSGGTADILITDTHHCMQGQPAVQYMSTDDLHCTARISYERRLLEFEEFWFTEANTTPTLKG